MTAPTTVEEQQLLDGLVQFRFSDERDELHSLNAADLAEVLQGLVDFTGQMAKAGLFGSGVPPEVRVRPPREGSFVVEAVLTWAGQNPMVAAGVAIAATAAAGKAGEKVVETAADALTETVKMASRTLRGNPAQAVEPLDNGDVLITWEDGTINQVSAKVWKQLNQTKTTKRALRKLLAPLGDDVSRMEIRGSTPAQSTEQVMSASPDSVLDRTDYRRAVAADPEPDDEVEVFDVEARLLSVDFRRGQRWRIETRQGSRRTERSARMEDEQFQQALDDGRALRKSDILTLKIREVLSVTNGRSSRDWTIVKVVSQRRGSGDDDDQASSDATTP